jgi:hypothetical protein
MNYERKTTRNTKVIYCYPIWGGGGNCILLETKTMNEYIITEEHLRNYRRGTITFEDIEAYAHSHQLSDVELREMPTLHDKERYMQGYRAGSKADSRKKPGCYSECPFDDLCANDVEKIQEIEKMSAENERQRLINLLDKFTKDSINICDVTHGKLSSPMKVKGMRVSFVCIENILKQCRTEEGIKLLEESLRGE